mgnify:CR=1 FL=1
MTPPDADDYEHDHQSEELTELHTHVEGDEILQQSVLGQIEFLYLGRQSEPVKEAEDENGGLRVGLKAKESLKASQVVKAFVDNREADDRVDQVEAVLQVLAAEREELEHELEQVQADRRDADRVGDLCDNCPDDANADQADRDADGEGDFCDCRQDGIDPCNGRDDDCDGQADEYDDVRAIVFSDPENCGACGNSCAAPNAQMGCSVGQCVVNQCDPGFVDYNGDANDGCEASCVLTSGGREVCDELDNDCDGVIDEDFDLFNLGDELGEVLSSSSFDGGDGDDKSSQPARDPTDEEEAEERMWANLLQPMGDTNPMASLSYVTLCSLCSGGAAVALRVADGGVRVGTRYWELTLSCRLSVLEALINFRLNKDAMIGEALRELDEDDIRVYV